MTNGLAERLTMHSRVIIGVRCAIGLLVLLPAFLIWMHVAVLANIARAEGAEANWHASVIPLTTLGFLITLGSWAFTRRPSLVRDMYMVAYCGYIVILSAYVSSGNFMHQLSLYGVGTALGNHLDNLAYLALALVFLFDRLILVFTTRREQSNF
jgi:hypothetical protein